MTTQAFVKPVGDLLVRREDFSGHIAPDGEDVTLTSYYLRHIKDGSLVKAKRTARKPTDKTDGGK